MMRLVVVWMMVAAAMAAPSVEDIKHRIAQLDVKIEDGSEYQYRKSDLEFPEEQLPRSGPPTINELECTEQLDIYDISLNSVTHFTSPNYPHNYPDDGECGWEFQASSGLFLHLYCKKIKLEANDYMHIFDYSNFSYKVMTDTSEKDFTYNFSGNRASIIFKSNDSGNTKGFDCYIAAADN